MGHEVLNGHVTAKGQIRDSNTLRAGLENGWI